MSKSLSRARWHKQKRPSVSHLRDKHYRQHYCTFKLRPEGLLSLEEFLVSFFLLFSFQWDTPAIKHGFSNCTKPLYIFLIEYIWLWSPNIALKWTKTKSACLQIAKIGWHFVKACHGLYPYRVLKEQVVMLMSDFIKYIVNDMIICYALEWEVKLTKFNHRKTFE